MLFILMDGWRMSVTEFEESRGERTQRELTCMWSKSKSPEGGYVLSAYRRTRGYWHGPEVSPPRGGAKAYTKSGPFTKTKSKKKLNYCKQNLKSLTWKMNFNAILFRILNSLASPLHYYKEFVLKLALIQVNFKMERILLFSKELELLFDIRDVLIINLTSERYRPMCFGQGKN